MEVGRGTFDILIFDTSLCLDLSSFQNSMVSLAYGYRSMKITPSCNYIHFPHNVRIDSHQIQVSNLISVLVVLAFHQEQFILPFSP